MNKIEIINETVEYYKNHRRGISIATGACVYKTFDGNMCAIGRCFENVEEIRYEHCPVEKLFDKFGDWVGYDKQLKEQYRTHCLEFWSDLQNLHDSKHNWEPNDFGGTNLTEYGEIQKNLLLEKWGNK